MLGLKISLATVFLLSLIIPFLIKPINGLYDIDQLKGLRAYCFLHADRAAQGENVVNDLIKSGLANSSYYDWSCSKISEEIEGESQKKLAFTLDCWNGNLTPSQAIECNDADEYRDGPVCLYDEEDVVMWYTESEWNSGRYQLTPEELSECKDKGYLGSGTWGNYGFSEEDEDKDEDKDEDTKEEEDEK